MNSQKQYVAANSYTRDVLWSSKYAKCVSGRSAAPHPAGEAYDAPPDPLVGWGWGYRLPMPDPTRRLDSRALATRRLWRLDFGPQNIFL